MAFILLQLIAIKAQILSTAASQQRQSPINIQSLNGTIVDEDFGYRYGNLSYEDMRTVNGKSLEFAFPNSDGYYLKTSVGGAWNLNIGELQFRPVQFHFHMGKGSTSSPTDDGSEHTIEGKHYPLEMHIVHLADDPSVGYVASVVGVLF